MGVEPDRALGKEHFLDSPDQGPGIALPALAWGGGQGFQQQAVPVGLQPQGADTAVLPQPQGIQGALLAEEDRFQIFPEVLLRQGQLPWLRLPGPAPATLGKVLLRLNAHQVGKGELSHVTDNFQHDYSASPRMDLVA